MPVSQKKSLASANNARKAHVASLASRQQKKAAYNSDSDYDVDYDSDSDYEVVEQRRPIKEKVVYYDKGRHYDSDSDYESDEEVRSFDKKAKKLSKKEKAALAKQVHSSLSVVDKLVAVREQKKAEARGKGKGKSKKAVSDDEPVDIPAKPIMEDPEPAKISASPVTPVAPAAPSAPVYQSSYSRRLGLNNAPKNNIANNIKTNTDRINRW